MIYQLLILNARGEIHRALPLKPIDSRVEENGTSYVGIFIQPLSRDLDGDGRREIIFFNDGKLTAARGGLQEVIWEWPLPEELRGDSNAVKKVLEIRPPGKDHPALVVVLLKDSLFGLNGLTGRLEWRCRGPGSALGWLPPTVPGDLPGGLFGIAKQYRNYDITVCQEALPAE
jgi:hypothetical protein